QAVLFGPNPPWEMKMSIEGLARTIWTGAIKSKPPPCPDPVRNRLNCLVTKPLPGS
ncbi:hypothetical protein B296_00043957, partial [Ensete ventricosum]